MTLEQSRHLTNSELDWTCSPCFIPRINNPAATGCNAGNTVWKIRTIRTLMPPQVAIEGTSCHHMWAKDIVDSLGLSIALRRSGVRIPSGLMTSIRSIGVLEWYFLFYSTMTVEKSRINYSLNCWQISPLDVAVLTNLNKQIQEPFLGFRPVY